MLKIGILKFPVFAECEVKGGLTRMEQVGGANIRNELCTNVRISLELAAPIVVLGIPLRHGGFPYWWANAHAYYASSFANRNTYFGGAGTSSLR